MARVEQRRPRGGQACDSEGSSATLSQVKPLVSKFLHDKQLPYNEDSYLARFQLFLDRYEEFMVHVPPITELVGVQ